MSFNFAQHGPIASHQYRGFYDSKAADGKPQGDIQKHCAYCNRRIRFCYAIQGHDHRTFVIGSCDFLRYKGTPLYKQLRAAQVLQRAYLRQRLMDIATFSMKQELDSSRRVWAKARRRAFFRLKKYREQHTHLNILMTVLEVVATRVPKAYKRHTLTRNWYQNQAAKIEKLISESSI